MSLYKRLHENGGAPAGAPAPSSVRNDPALDELRHRVHGALIEELGPILYDKRLGEDELRSKVHEALHTAIAQERTPLSAADKAQLIQDVSDDILGYGPIDKLLRDEDVSEIMCNGPKQIYVERKGKLTLDEVTFVDEMHLRRIIDKIVAQVGRRIDESSPLCRRPLARRIPSERSDLAALGRWSVPDHPKVRCRSASHRRPHPIRHPVACTRPVSSRPASSESSTWSSPAVPVPERRRHSTCSPRSSRPTSASSPSRTPRNSSCIQDHVLSLETRPPNMEGKGEVSIRDLVKNTLRMRPDRIVVGECRSGEALDMLQAMNTGHDGSLTTLHANSPRDTLSRLETLVLMAGYDLPVRAIREQIASAVDMIVQLQRLRDGSRRITHITEVAGMEGDVVTLQDVFLFDFSAGVDETGRFKGSLKPTGVRPKFAQKLADHGIRLGPRSSSPIRRPAGGRGQTMTRRLGPLAALVAIVLILAGLALLPAGAQDQGDFLEVLAVDARSPRRPSSS